jgi:ubiquitin carboxyl-terminal hydrolase 7
VSRATKRDAIEANYGGEETEQPQRAYTNAYMLVYLRRADLTRVLCDVDKDTIPVELHTIMNDEAATEEKRKKEKSEAHLYATVNVSQ